MFYAVRKGREPGVYLTWKDCEERIRGFRGALFRKFASREDAEDYARGIDRAYRPPDADEGWKPRLDAQAQSFISDVIDRRFPTFASLPAEEKQPEPEVAKPKADPEPVAKRQKTERKVINVWVVHKNALRPKFGAYFGEDHPYNSVDFTFHKTPHTPTRLGIAAVVRALSECHRAKEKDFELVVHCDSRYLHTALRKMIECVLKRKQDDSHPDLFRVFRQQLLSGSGTVSCVRDPNPENFDAARSMVDSHRNEGLENLVPV
jgi:hypothetical protein